MATKSSTNSLLVIALLTNSFGSAPVWAESKSTTTSGTTSNATVTAPAAGKTMPIAPARSTVMQNDPLALYKRTGINQEQIDKINALTSEFQKLLTAKTQVLIGLMRDIRALSLQSDPDEKATLAKQGEINALNNEMADQRIKLMLNLRKVLSPEQRQKLVELMKQGQTVPAGTQAPPASSVPSEPGASGKAKQTTQQH